MIASQKRLSSIMLALGVVGSFFIGLLWWDSTLYSNVWFGKLTNIASIESFAGAERIPRHYPTNVVTRLEREIIDPSGLIVQNYFPKPQRGFLYIVIPYYLILLTYLATLLLAWLILMNRLARREARMELPTPKT